MTFTNSKLTNAEKFVIRSAAISFANRQDCLETAEKAFQIAQKAIDLCELVEGEECILYDILLPYEDIQGRQVGKDIFTNFFQKVI